MNETPAPATPASAMETVTRPAKRRHIPRLFGWLFAGLAVLVLAGLALPVFSGGCGMGVQTRDLAYAKQVGLALKLFAGDHDGAYPRQGVPSVMTTAPSSSNEAFACLFPTYTQSETIFGNQRSAYQTGKGGDNLIDNPYTGHPKETLRPGENTYAYVVGLTDANHPSTPLVLDGTADGLHYVSDPTKRGGTWKGTKAVVIRLDNSGALENLTGPADARIIVDRDHPGTNLLDVAKLGPGIRVLDPAIARPTKP